MKNIIWKHHTSESFLLANNSLDDLNLFPVSVTCEDSTVIFASHVIVTCSLGYLKANHSVMFEPSLPYHLATVIDALGFGVIDKIFLHYEEPWWDEGSQAFQIVQTQLESTNENHEVTIY